MNNVWLLRSKDKYYKSETKRCFKDFSYFANNYLKFGTPNKKLELYPFHERLIDHYQTYRFSVVTKFRQAGFLTYTAAYMLWNCLLKLDKRAVFISKSDREAVAIGEMVQDWINNLPNWLQPESGKWNDHIKEFSDTNGSMSFMSAGPHKAKGCDWLVIDEPAFIPDMQNVWNSMWPVLSTGGNCIAVGTVGKKWDDDEKTKKNWFYKLHGDSFNGLNKFKIFDVNYKEHPDYADPALCMKLRKNLGVEGWKQEIEMEFLD